MLFYVDSSALLKRVLNEAETDVLEDSLKKCAIEGQSVIASALAWIEVSRGLSVQLGEDHGSIADRAEDALAGVVERPITDAVISVARHLTPPVLRSLDAIHLATAVLNDADRVITYDRRLAEAARHHRIPVVAPGVEGL